MEIAHHIHHNMVAITEVVAAALDVALTTMKMMITTAGTLVVAAVLLDLVMMTKMNIQEAVVHTAVSHLMEIKTMISMALPLEAAMEVAGTMMTMKMNTLHPERASEVAEEIT